VWQLLLTTTPFCCARRPRLTRRLPRLRGRPRLATTKDRGTHGHRDGGHGAHLRRLAHLGRHVEGAARAGGVHHWSGRAHACLVRILRGVATVDARGAVRVALRGRRHHGAIYVFIYINLYLHPSIPTYPPMYMNASAHTHTHICIHIYIYMFIYIYIYIDARGAMRPTLRGRRHHGEVYFISTSICSYIPCTTFLRT